MRRCTKIDKYEVCPQQHVVEATVNKIMQGVIHYKCDATKNIAIASVLLLRQHVRHVPEPMNIIIIVGLLTIVIILWSTSNRGPLKK